MPIRALRLQQPSEDRPERHATWTELFFDLVFVVAVAQLAAGLHEHVSASGALAFAGLFVPVWWTWTTYAYVADLFDADEGAFRLVLLAAMLGSAALAATIPQAFEGHTAAFVVAYALLRADLVALYAWAWRTDPAVSRLAAVHAAGFGAGLVVWLASLAVPAPARYAVWALAIAVDLGTGLVAYLRREDVPVHRSHMPERFGLFTLIVLGESVLAVSAGTASADWALAPALTAAAGFVLAVALWWLYFARFDEEVFNIALRGDAAGRRRSFVFGYGHVVVFASLAAVGAGVRLGLDRALEGGAAGDAAAVLGAAVAGSLAGLALVQWAAPGGLPGRAVAARGAVAAGALALAIWGAQLDALAVVALCALGVVLLGAGEALTATRLRAARPPAAPGPGDPGRATRSGARAPG
jgi:low temperature requirement protein LtrA